MAGTDNTKVLTVDTADAITSLKDFKKHLDDLKGTLLGLEQGTDEYKKVAEELRSGQQKLNDVMYESKKNSEALEGSYDHLVVKMRELKKEWRATTDEGRRNDLGNQILEINNRLKELDASTGNFQRNVGDYKNAFAEAFDKALGPLGKMNGTLGTLARDIKGMVPLIKQINTTAISGLQGIKGAIAATGIGLLVIAVGELAAHWEDIYKWATGVNDVIEDIEKTQQKITDASDEQMKNMGYQVQLMQAEGKTNVQILQYQIQEVKNAIAKLKVYKEIVDKKIEELELHSVLTKAFSGEYYLIDKLKESSEETNTKIAQLSDKLEGLEVGLKAAEIREGIDKLKDLSKKGADIKKQMDALKESAKKFIDTLKSADDSDLTKVRKKYEEDKAVLEEYLKGKAISEEQYYEGLALLEDRYRKERNEIIDKDLKEQAEKDKEIKLKAFEDTLNEIKEKAKGAEVSIKLNIDKREMEKDLEKSDPMKQLFGSFDLKGLFSNEGIQKEYEQAVNDINTLYGAKIDGAQKELEVLQKKQEQFPDDPNIAAEIAQKQTEIKTLQTEQTIALGDAEIENNNKVAESWAARAEVISQALGATASIMNSLAQSRQTDIEMQLKEGKISEQEANKKFKRVKKLQKAAAIMETAQAAMGAYSSLASIPYVGPALGAAAAAAAIAAGMVQIKQIEKTTLSNSSSSVSTPDLSPITNTYEPTYVSNVQTNSELSDLTNAMGNISPVVQVSDIESGLEQRKTRVVETTY